MSGSYKSLNEFYGQPISKETYTPGKIHVRKVYINEDPSKEDVIPCPRCLHRNRKHMVRYLYLNLNEAIYKCEAADCMYPFRNFKFKNFEENSVYHYELPLHKLPAVHASSADYATNSIKNIVSESDLNWDFLYCNNELGNLKPDPSATKIRQRTIKPDNNARNFDTAFIDEMLKDLFPSASNLTDKAMHETRSTTTLDQNSPSNSSYSEGRKLQKCLKILQNQCKNSEEGVFKKPIALNKMRSDNLMVERISPTKLRIKKILTPNIKTRGRCINTKKKPNKSPHLCDSSVNEIMQARALVKNKVLKPLEFVCTLNTLIQKEAIEASTALHEPIVQKNPNQAKVQRMLNFIQRSMQNCDPQKHKQEAIRTSPNIENSNDNTRIEPSCSISSAPLCSLISSNSSSISSSIGILNNKSMLDSTPSKPPHAGGMELFIRLLES
ncbi:uncharacterized protein LOC128725019 [Anopheles nili]|uniref:uncharacterized protein LOC128725019 n=1 Tax=Anopheles nili TaxID=185578 RepID=UPI00237B1631|nr:uncharacterized protein LOC128725019 [Anopheles nili]